MKLQGSFIRYISHELRSPLNTIALGLYLQSNHSSGDDSRHSLGSASDKMQEYDQASTLLDMIIACDHSVSVLNNLAIYEMLERGVHLMPREIRIYDFLRDLITFNIDKANARNKAVLLSEPVDEALNIWINVDSYRLQQVFENIFTVLLNLTPKDKTILFSQTKIAERFARHATYLKAPKSSKKYSAIIKYLAGLLSRTRTTPDALGYVRITVSTLQYVPPEVMYQHRILAVVLFISLRTPRLVWRRLWCLLTLAPF